MTVLASALVGALVGGACARVVHGPPASPGVGARAALAPPRHLHFTSVLGERQRQILFDRIAARMSELRPSDVTGADKSYRRSHVLYHARDLAPEFVDAIGASAPSFAHALGVPPFARDDVEAQLTVSSGGDYFKAHNDNGSPDTATRRLSWVYYAHPSPLRFTGGELLMSGAPGAPPYVIRPESDTLIVFPSDVYHEVRPTRAWSRALDHARVTLNGWVRERM